MKSIKHGIRNEAFKSSQEHIATNSKSKNEIDDKDIEGESQIKDTNDPHPIETVAIIEERKHHCENNVGKATNTSVRVAETKSLHSTEWNQNLDSADSLTTKDLENNKSCDLVSIVNINRNEAMETSEHNDISRNVKEADGSRQKDDYLSSMERNESHGFHSEEGNHAGESLENKYTDTNLSTDEVLEQNQSENASIPDEKDDFTIHQISNVTSHSGITELESKDQEVAECSITKLSEMTAANGEHSKKQVVNTPIIEISRRFPEHEKGRTQDCSVELLSVISIDKNGPIGHGTIQELEGAAGAACGVGTGGEKGTGHDCSVEGLNPGRVVFSYRSLREINNILNHGLKRGVDVSLGKIMSSLDKLRVT